MRSIKKRFGFLTFAVVALGISNIAYSADWSINIETSTIDSLCFPSSHPNGLCILAAGAIDLAVINPIKVGVGSVELYHARAQEKASIGDAKKAEEKFRSLQISQVQNPAVSNEKSSKSLPAEALSQQNGVTNSVSARIAN